MLTCHCEYANEQSNGSSSEHHLLLGIIAFLLLSSGPNANSQNYTVKEHDAHHTSDADHLDDDGVVLLSTNLLCVRRRFPNFYSEKWMSRMRDICWASYRSWLGAHFIRRRCKMNNELLCEHHEPAASDTRPTMEKATKLNEWIMCLLLLLLHV